VVCGFCPAQSGSSNAKGEKMIVGVVARCRCKIRGSKFQATRKLLPYIYIYIHIYIYTHTQYIYIYFYLHISVYLCMRICMYACIYLCMYAYMYVCLCILMYVCIYVFIYFFISKSVTSSYTTLILSVKLQDKRNRGVCVCVWVCVIFTKISNILVVTLWRLKFK